MRVLLSQPPPVPVFNVFVDLLPHVDDLYRRMIELENKNAKLEREKANDIYHHLIEMEQIKAKASQRVSAAEQVQAAAEQTRDAEAKARHVAEQRIRELELLLASKK